MVWFDAAVLRYVCKGRLGNGNVLLVISMAIVRLRMIGLVPSAVQAYACRQPASAGSFQKSFFQLGVASWYYQDQ